MIGLASVARTIGIKGGVIIALGIALAIVMWRADAISADREAMRNTLAAERAQHAVTRQSLATLESELGKMVRDGELRAERLEEALEAQDERSAALRAQAERIRAEGGVDACVTPDAVRGASGL